ncbi:ABC transporter permease subunit [Bradyrhizobium liaoningense]|uniref:ABC transporter permease subunit n=1 Tax=Bradyrhizobium liaoningense TaxID=43992 RepID=UPI001BA88D15|nr:ATP-binding cassette domain-containing protein [Bradyrhizobium liaoningense]
MAIVFCTAADLPDVVFIPATVRRLMDIALVLLQDGITTGAAYALLSLSLVLVFVVSRVVMVQAGEFVSYAALSLAAIQSGQVPALAWITTGICVAIGILDMVRGGKRNRSIRSGLRWIVLPVAILIATIVLVPRQPPGALQIVLALAIVVPLGPAMYRLAFRRIARASTLMLLIVSIAVQFVMGGVGLAVFGPEGGRTSPIADGFFDFGPLSVSAQSLWLFGITVILIATLFLFFRRSMYGMALRAAAYEPRGALLMGISPENAGQLSFGLAAFLCAVTGVLISPLMTIYYDTGFVIGLKAFIGAVAGGFVSYPLAAIGALGIGIFESFAAYASSTYKEVLVFLPMVLILLLRSIVSRPAIDSEDEFAGEMTAPSRAPSAHVSKIVAQFSRPQFLGLGAVLLIGLPYLLTQSQILVLDYILLYAFVVIGIVLLTGIAGQVSFGQAAFVGVGAYTAAVAAGPCAHWDTVMRAVGLVPFAASCGLPAIASLLLSLALTAIIAAALGAITLRMRSHFLPIATISWAICFYYFFGTSDLLGGFSGLTDIRLLPIDFPAGLSYEARLYYPMLVATAACTLAIANLLNSRTGRAIRALHSRNVLAESSGVATARLKNQVFVFAALIACLSGWFYAQLERFVSPSPFSLLAGAEYLFMAVVGGVGELIGAFFGAAIVKVLREFLQDAFTFTSLGRFGDFERILFGVAIILLIQFTRGGAAYLMSGILPRRPLIRDKNDACEPSAVGEATGTLLLDIRGLSKQFGGLAALRNISFQVRAGEIVALIGPNGAGKSTLFNTVTGILSPSNGTISIRERSIRSLSAHAISSLGVMRTFQHVKLLSDRSVLENVALGAYGRGRSGFIRSMLRLDRAEERRTIAHAHRCVERVGLGGVADKLCAELPLGQQRLVEVARALAGRPALLLLDEPAAGLRYREKQALAVVLRQLRVDGMGILIVEHDMGLVMGLADRIVVMNFGEKIAEGNASEIQSNPLVREAYLGV